MHVGDDHWLVVDEEGLPPINRIPTVRTAVLDALTPGGLVWHWTGGVCRGPNVPTILANENRTYNKDTDRPASWHVCIGKDGMMVQAVPFNVGSWHVGRPGRIGAKPALTADGKWDATSWAGGVLKANINRCTVGVELANSGRLEKVGDKFYTSPWWLDPAKPDSGPDPRLEIEAERAVAVGDQWFDVFPQAQIDAAKRLLTALVLKYKWTRDVSQYGHVMFDPSRKEDPGPLWLQTALPALLDSVFGAE